MAMNFYRVDMNIGGLDKTFKIGSEKIGQMEDFVNFIASTVASGGIRASSLYDIPNRPFEDCTLKNDQAMAEALRGMFKRVPECRPGKGIIWKDSSRLIPNSQISAAVKLLKILLPHTIFNPRSNELNSQKFFSYARIDDNIRAHIRSLVEQNGIEKNLSLGMPLAEIFKLQDEGEAFWKLNVRLITFLLLHKCANISVKIKMRNSRQFAGALRNLQRFELNPALPLPRPDLTDLAKDDTVLVIKPGFFN